MGQLALAILGEPRIGHRPGVSIAFAGDDADPDAKMQEIVGRAFFRIGGSGILDGVAPRVLAAASPASDEPEINIPGTSASGKGGVNLSIATLWKSPS